MKRNQRYSGLFDKSEIQYLNNLSKFSTYKFLSNEDVNNVVLEYRATKNITLMNTLLQQFMRLTISVAKKYKTKDIDIGDLIHEAMEGIIEAVQTHYDPNTPEKMVTYIQKVIERRIKDAYDRSRQAISLPKNIMSIQGQMLGGKIDISDSTIYTKMSVGRECDWKNIHSILGLLANAADSKLIQESLEHDIDRVLEVVLSQVEKTVIIHSFGLCGTIPKSLDSISDIFKLTPQRIGDLKTSALKKLQTNEEGVNILSKYLS